MKSNFKKLLVLIMFFWLISVLAVVLQAKEVSRGVSIKVLDTEGTESITSAYFSGISTENVYRVVIGKKSVRLALTADDSSTTISVNGEQVENDGIVSVDLQQGKNDIVLKIGDLVSILTLDNKPSDYVEISLACVNNKFGRYLSESVDKFCMSEGSIKLKECEFDNEKIVESMEAVFMVNKVLDNIAIKVNGEYVDNTSSATILDSGDNIFNIEIFDGNGVVRKYSCNIKVKASDSQEETWQNPFVDVSITDDFYNVVKYCNINGLMNGVSENEFNPNGTESRAMVATILYRMMGEPKVTVNTPFSDVESGTWYYNAVNWAASAGIVNGYGDNRFGPNDNITREQLVTILYRFASGQGVELINYGIQHNYADFDDISRYAIEAMNWGLLRENAIMTSRTRTEICPTLPATRAEITRAMANLSRNVMK